MWLAALMLAGMQPKPVSAASDPQVVGNPTQWIGPDDYPAQAIRDEAEGRTVVALSIDDQGGVVDCRIAVSSGSTVLDDRTCRLIRSRARFRPARDAQGRAVSGQYRTAIRWVLPLQSIRGELYFMELRYADARVVACHVRFSGIPVSSDATGRVCADIAASPLMHALRANGFDRAETITLTTLRRLDADPMPALGADQRRIIIAEAAFALGNDRRVTECVPRTTIDLPGPGPNLCDMLPNAGRFAGSDASFSVTLYATATISGG